MFNIESPRYFIHFIDTKFTKIRLNFACIKIDYDQYLESHNMGVEHVETSFVFNVLNRT